MSVIERINLLAKPFWTNADIRNYVGCGSDKASKIHRLAIKKYKGIVPAQPKKVKRNSVLDALGLNVLEEIEFLNHLKGVEDNG